MAAPSPPPPPPPMRARAPAPPPPQGTGCGRGLAHPDSGYSSHTRSSQKPSGRDKKYGGPSKHGKVHLIDLRRANNTEIMLMNVKMPPSDMIAAILAMDESVLEVNLVENLIRFCPTKEDMELLKNYTGDTAALGKCEQHFLELMKVPRVESKLRAFSFKIQFNTQITYFKRRLNTVNSACEELRTSQKLKEIMERVLYMENQETARAPVKFNFFVLKELCDRRGANSKRTLHHLCKVLASEDSPLLDFHKDLESLKSASKIGLIWMAEGIQAMCKGLEKLHEELKASESDGSASEVFCKTLKDFITIAETEVATLMSLYNVVRRNIDELVLYFGEDPKSCSFEQVIAALLNFVRLFKQAHERIVASGVGESHLNAKDFKVS